MMNLYRVLGVAEPAEPKQIKQAYRKLAKKYHPDLNPGDVEAEKRFKEATDAYEILSNPEKRKKYDESLRNTADTAGRQSRRAGTSASQAPYRSSEDWNVWEDLMRRMGQGSAETMNTGRTGKQSQGAQAGTGKKESGAERESSVRTNPIDVSEMFEKYMRMK